MKKKVQLNSLWLGKLLFFVFFSNYSIATVCDDLPKLTLEECGHYDFIAYGRIESDLDCNDEQISFYPISVFKGYIEEKTVDLFTSCSDNGLPLSEGEYWILYGFYNNAQQIKLTICGHSRKQIAKDEVDYQYGLRGSSFQEDLTFLKENFSLKVFGKKELLPKKYEKVNPKLVPILLSVGLVFMVIGYFVIKKLK